MSNKKKKKNKKDDKIQALARFDIIRFLKTSPHRAFNHKQIASGAGLRGHISHNKLVGILDALVAKGKLTFHERGKYSLAFEQEYIVGSLSLARDGFGFVMIEGKEEEVFIPSKYIGKGMPKDKVQVQIIRPKRKNNKAEGKIVEVLERAKSLYVGTIEMEGNLLFVSPDDPHIPTDFRLKEKNRKDAKNGQKVLVKIIDWEKDFPEVAVERVLGNVGENETEMHAILYQYGFDPEFPPEVEAEAEAIPKKITKGEISKRRDMRKVLTFTIDPDDAKDFDDALSVEKLENGNWEIGIHIADVAHYLKPGTLLDKEAERRATSVYLVDRTVPMLPEVLSNNLCSLRPNEEKLVFSAIFELDENGKVHQQWIGRSVINSNHRFTYEEAQTSIDSGEGEFSEELRLLNRIAHALRKERFKHGSLGFEEIEVKFELDEKGKPIGIYKKERKDSHKLIEDFMLLANKKVDEFAAGLRKNPPLPFVHRNHDRPDEEKLSTLKQFVKNFGYELEIGNTKETSKSLNNLVTNVQGKPEQHIVQKIAIRTMSKAVYSIENIGHYGLGFSNYTHFTSPIRRYPDVMVHRLLAKYLANDFKVDKARLMEQCKHSSNMEKKASEAERASVKYKQVEFLEDKVGKTFSGIVSGVTRWGVYVELEENRCEGMIAMTDLGDDFYELDQENYCVRGRRTRKEIHLGDKVVILVKDTDLIRRVIDFELVEHNKEIKFQKAR